MKEIIILNNITNFRKDEDIIAIFNSTFPEKEASLKFSDNNLKLMLREININKLEELITKYIDYDKLGLLKKIHKSISDIKSYGLNNGKRNYIDYNKEKKVKNRKQKVKLRGIYYYAQGNNFSKINNSITKDFENKIICGDSLKELQKLPDNCIDLVFT
ncbi:MAG: site-specific DNA-methyltransferase, partial [Candidatus Cloacimonetes bacterium]|nr:site-specific DNA-methyltransferase [Candidatus Cloacimonadota bacterium]